MRERICNNCGGKKYKEIGQNMVKCLFCGTIYVDEYANKEEEILIVQAYEKIRDFKFQQAVADFDKILALYPKSHEAYYGRLQAKNKVIYYNSKEGTKRYPSFFGKEIPNYFEDDDFKKAVEFAQKEIAESYNEQASRVEKIRNEWLQDAKNYSCDVVLNFKERTKNFEKINRALNEKGLKVFLRDEIKKQKKNIEAYTFQAINTAKVEVLLLEKPENLFEPKIRNLYQRFLYRIEIKDRFPSSFVVVYDDKNVSLDEIKKTFPNLKKLYSLNDINFVEDLSTFVKSATERNYNENIGLEKRDVENVTPTKKEQVEIVTVMPSELGHYNVENVPLSDKNRVKWIFYSIKNGDFETAERLIKEEKEKSAPSGEVYFASLLCEKKIRTEEEFFANIENFKNKEELENVLKYSSTNFANDFVNKWERLIVQEKDVDNYLTYMEFLAQYKNSMHDDFLKEAENLAIETMNEDLINTILKCYDPKDIDRYTNFYFQLAQKSGDETYYHKILELDEGHIQSLFALFTKNFDTVEEKLSYRDGKALENVLKYCDADRRSGFLTDIINIVSEVSFYDIKKAEAQFDFYLSYINNDEILQSTLLSLGKKLQTMGFFSLAEKYLTLAIKNDKENAEIYWLLIQVKTHCHSENELLTTSVKISEMDDWATVLNYASDSQSEKYAQIVAKANTSSDKKVFRQELLDKVTLKEKLREFLVRNDKVLNDADDKATVKYYRQQFTAFESYFDKIDNSKTFDEYNEIFTRLFDRLDMMDLTIDTSVNIAKISTKKENLAVLEKEEKKRDEKYLSVIEEEKRNRKRKIVLFCTLELAPMLLLLLFLILVISAPKEMYMVFSQDGVIIFTILSVILGLGNLIYNSIKKKGEKKWRIARLSITMIGFANLICLLFGFYIYPPEISILNADEFNKIVHNASYVDISLENDIDMNNFSWGSVDFYGNIEGNNHRIFNLKFRNQRNNYGLFDELGGNVHNLTIEIVEGTYENVSNFGALAITNNGKIENCSAIVSCNIASTSSEVVIGGLVAYQGAGQILNSSVSGTLSISSSGNIIAGGLAGQSRSENELSKNLVEISFDLSFNGGSLNFGGLVGENNSVITESKADINFNLSGQLENGFVGGIAGTSRSGINNSYATGTYNLNSTNVTTGGLVGEFSRRREVVEYCYQNIEIQNVSGVTGALVGSLREGIFRNSFAVSTLENTYGSKELNTELAPYPERNNCQIFASAEQVTNSFGFSSEIWDFDETLPELICFINS